LPTIRHTVTIRVTPGVVYAAVTEPEGLAAWWTRDLDVAVRIGGVSTFRFPAGAWNRMEIEDLSPPWLVRWRCVGGAPEWIGTTVVFRLEAGDGGSLLRFEHGNWREATAYMAECGAHWERYLGGLARYCEEGGGDMDGGVSPPCAG